MQTQQQSCLCWNRAVCMGCMVVTFVCACARVCRYFLSCAALVSWWRIINFLLCSHNFHWGFQERCQQANVQSSSESLDEVRVCKEWWVLVQWRVLSPLATALWTGQIAKLCVSMCLSRVCVFFLRCWLSCVIEDIHTSACHTCTCVRAVYALFVKLWASRVKVCVCVFDVWFLKQRAALELLRASERNIWCWNMVSHLIDNKYQEMCGEEESGHTVVKVRVSQGEQVKETQVLSAETEGASERWIVDLKSHREAERVPGSRERDINRPFPASVGTLKLQYVLFYILQFHFFFLWLKIGRLLRWWENFPSKSVEALRQRKSPSPLQITPPSPSSSLIFFSPQ